MKTFLLIFLVALSAIAVINCHSIDKKVLNRVKRADEEGFFGKVKTGLTTFGSKTKKFFVNGYEETKNLFSSDRKVGDYTADTIDIRFDDDDDDASSSTEASRNKRDSPVFIEGIKASDEGFDDVILEEFVENKNEKGIISHLSNINFKFSKK